MKKELKKGKIEQISTGVVASVIFVLVIAVVVSVLLPRIMEIYGDGTIWQIGNFVLLLLFAIGMVLLARWQFNEIEKKSDQEDAESEKKSVLKKIVAKESAVFNNIAKTAFHLLPFYFPFVFVRMDLLPEFKVILFAFSMLAYLLVELRYAFERIRKINIYLIKKLNIQNIFLQALSAILVAAIFFVVAGYVGYKLVAFYINQLS